MRLVTLMTLISHVYGHPLLKTFVKKPEKGLPRDSEEFLWKIIFSAGLVLAGGVFAGYDIVFELSERMD